MAKVCREKIYVRATLGSSSDFVLSGFDRVVGLVCGTIRVFSATRHDEVFNIEMFQKFETWVYWRWKGFDNGLLCVVSNLCERESALIRHHMDQ